MARFSKAALLKFLHKAEKITADARDRAAEKRKPLIAEWYDGQWTAYAQLEAAIERGEIGEGQ